MTQAEFDKQDEQVMGMVNSAASPDSAENAEKIACAFSGSRTAAAAEAEKKRRLLYLALRVVLCLLAACMFRAAQENAIFAQTLSAVCFLVFIVAGAILVDRHFRR